MSPEALARLREAVEWAVSGGALHVDKADLRALLDAYDGEPARLAAARAAAIMEWRAGAADRDELRADCERRIAAAADELRTLRAALERATEGVRYWTDLAQAEARDAAALRARDVEDHPGGALLIAEVAALRARVAELERCAEVFVATVKACERAEAQVAEAHERLDEFGMRRDGESATLVEGIAAMRERIDEYRAEWYRAEAQMAAARAALERIANPKNYGPDGGWDAKSYPDEIASDALQAMDNATK